jgi:hypothetical protein
MTPSDMGSDLVAICQSIMYRFLIPCEQSSSLLLTYHFQFFYHVHNKDSLVRAFFFKVDVTASQRAPDF